MIPSIVNIDPHGDLLLHVKHQDCLDQLYRVSISALRSTSAFFDSLLDPTKFSEGLAVHKRRVEVVRQFNEIAAVPPLELPRVTILDIGQVPSEAIAETVFRHFLSVLHDPSSTLPSVPRIHFIAILVLIADRLGAVEPVAKYVNRHGWMRDPIKNDRHFKSGALAEVVLRQKILIGFIVRSSTSVDHYSAILIREGSSRWTTDDTDAAEESAWWHLPHGIEGQCQRCYMPVTD